MKVKKCGQINPQNLNSHFNLSLLLLIYYNLKKRWFIDVKRYSDSLQHLFFFISLYYMHTHHIFSPKIKRVPALQFVLLHQI